MYASGPPDFNLMVYNFRFSLDPYWNPQISDVTIADGKVTGGDFIALDTDEGLSFGGGRAFYNYDFGYHSAAGSLSGQIFQAPEPDRIALMLAGLGVLGATRWRRRAHRRIAGRPP